jgi:thiamine-phosphate pyrophosphorylase
MQKNPAMKKPPSFNISGLYAITPNEYSTSLLCKQVEAAIQGGAKLVQYRNKVADAYLRLRQSTALLALCRSRQVPFIINDHLDLCAEIDADGLHIGSEDWDLSAARRLLGDDKIIGSSCYNRLDLAIKAEQAGASYVAFGACFPSQTKPDAIHAPLNLFAEAKHKISIPLVAIGGINLENAPQIITAGADAIAVVGALFDADNMVESSRQFTNLFSS